MSGGSLGGAAGTALGVALAPATGGMSLIAPALGGAAGGALGGYLTGSDNIWRDALFGGIGGAATGGLNSLYGDPTGLAGSITNPLNPATDAVTALDAAGAAAPSTALYTSSSMTPAASTFSSGLGAAPSLTSASPSMYSSLADDVGMGIGNAAANVASTAAPAASFGSKLLDYAPYAGLGVAGMMADKMMKPKQVGPQMASHPSNPGKVAPLVRQYQSVDPNAYYTSGGNRSFFSDYSMQPQFMAKGGSPRRRYADGGDVDYSDKEMNQIESNMILARMGQDHPMINTAAHIVNRYNNSDYPGTIKSYIKDEYGDAPITREMLKVSGGARKYAGGGRCYMDGGSSSASSSNIPQQSRRINGRGDGQSDSIPAQLSDGEFVISAPVVSALGRGSNDAGARKLDKLQKQVMKSSYKGAKAPKNFGIGGYVH